MDEEKETKEEIRAPDEKLIKKQILMHKIYIALDILLLIFGIIIAVWGYTQVETFKQIVEQPIDYACKYCEQLNYSCFKLTP